MFKYFGRWQAKAVPQIVDSSVGVEYTPSLSLIARTLIMFAHKNRAVVAKYHRNEVILGF